MRLIKMASVLIVLVIMGLVFSTVFAGMTFRERPLNGAGFAYEVNTTGQNTVVITDYGSGEIWRYEINSGNMVSYLVGGGPSDAREDGNGAIWWVDFASNQVGRIKDQDLTGWEIPDSTSLFSTAISSPGTIWVSDNYQSYIYELNTTVSPNRLCTHSLPDDGSAGYMLFHNGMLWFGDISNGRIVRLNSDDGTITAWQLDQSSYPWGITVDNNGYIWWTDTGNNEIGRLNPNATTNNVTIFPVPSDRNLQMITSTNGRILVSLQSNAGIGDLDPVQASKTTYTIDATSFDPDSVCDDLAPSISKTISSNAQNASWENTSYASSIQDGWTFFDLPDSSIPFGIASTTQGIFMVDQGRKVLVQSTVVATIRNNFLFLPAVMK